MCSHASTSSSIKTKAIEKKPHQKIAQPTQFNTARKHHKKRKILLIEIAGIDGRTLKQVLKEKPRQPSMRWLIIMPIIFYVASCAAFGDDSFLMLKENHKEHERNLINKLILAYFQYQGVRSLNLIVCPSQSNNTSKYACQWQL